MASFNRVILMGNLTRDPEVRFLPSGMPVADVAIAVNDRYQDKQTQEWVDRPNFIDCTAFGKSAESIGKFFTKGRPIHIEGKLRFEQWDDKTSGQKRSKLKVVIDQWTFCDSRNDGRGLGRRTRRLPVGPRRWRRRRSPGHQRRRHPFLRSGQVAEWSSDRVKTTTLRVSPSRRDTLSGPRGGPTLLATGRITRNPGA